MIVPRSVQTMAREGLKYVVPMGAVTAVCLIAFGSHPLTYIAAILAFAFVLFFRLPAAPALVGDGAVLSPAGGFVIEVVPEQEPVFLKSLSQRISIFMTPLDVHVNTAPFSGDVKYAEYKRGTFFKADRPEARLQNERMSIGIERPDGIKCLATQVAGWLARRIICDVKPGDVVTRGARYGMIEFGSRMDIHLPHAARVLVRAGQHVRTARTVLAEI